MTRWFSLVLIAATAVEAAPRDFTFTSDSRVLEPKKAMPFVEITPRTGRRVYYSRFDTNAGAMLGIVPGLETYLQLDTYFDFTGQPPAISGAGHVTSLWRYRFVPADEPLGFLVQLKASLGFDELVLGARFVADYRATALRVTFNAALDRIIPFKDKADAKGLVTMRSEEALSLGYMLKNTLTPGLEFLAQQSMTDEKFLGSAFFMGGGLTCQRAWGWFSIGMLLQVAAVKPESDANDGEKLELRDHERFLFRLSFGVNAL